MTGLSPSPIFQAPSYDYNSHLMSTSRKYAASASTAAASYRDNISSSDDGTGGCLAPPPTEHRRHSLTDRIANALKL